MQENHAERAHAKFSPSGFARLIKCPSHLVLIKDAPSVKASPAAEWGTEVHEISSKILYTALKEHKSPSLILDQIDDDDKREVAEFYTDFCIDLYGQIRAVADKTPKCYIEHKVGLTDNIWGTADFIIHFVKGGKDYLIVVDLKTGYTPVDAEDNAQLRVYGLAAAKTLGIEPDAYYLYIVQPKVYEDGFARAKVEHSEMYDFHQEVKKVEKKALKILQTDDLSHLAVGDHCKFCPARALMLCPEHNGAVKGAIGVNPNNLPATIPSYKKLPIEKMIQAYQMKQSIESWLSDLEHHLMGLMLRGDNVPGLKLVHSRAYSRWLKNEKKVAEGLKKLGVKSPFKQKLITITEAKKLTKKDISKLIEKSQPKLQLTVASDPRPAVNKTDNSLLDMVDEYDSPKAKSRPKQTKTKSKRRK